MKHKSPAKLLRSIKRITKFLENKLSKPVLSSPVTEQDIAPAVPLTTPSPQITLEEFKSLLNRETERRLEQRRKERIEDMKKLQFLLSKPP